MLISFEGGEPVKVLDLSTDDNSYVYWTPDGRALSFIGRVGGGTNIWTQPLDGGKPVQVTDFKTDKILNFAWSKDGKQLAVARHDDHRRGADKRVQVRASFAGTGRGRKRLPGH